MANTQTTVPLFVANTVLTAAQQNISAGTGVPVFATTVTRDAAFGGSNKALAEGQLAYIEASNIVQYYDGAAWATVGPVTSDAGLVFISSSSFSASSAVNLDSVFSATYNNYKIVLSTTASVNGVSIGMRMRVGGTTNSSAQYNYFQMTSANANYYASTGSTANTSWSEISYLNSGEPRSSLIFEMFNPFQTTYTSGITMRARDVSITPVFSTNILGMSVTTSFDGFSIIPASGNITGTVAVYGMRNS